MSKYTNPASFLHLTHWIVSGMSKSRPFGRVREQRAAITLAYRNLDFLAKNHDPMDVRRNRWFAVVYSRK